MATIAPKPFVLKDYLLTVGDDLYQAQTSQVEIVPKVNVQTWRGGTPGALFSDITVDGWDYTIAYAQDFETTDSLSLFAHENAGEPIDVVFKPRSGTGPTVEVTIVMVPGKIGGTVGAFASGTLTGPCVGEPVIVPAA